jgi:hypothetical protein
MSKQASLEYIKTTIKLISLNISKMIEMLSEVKIQLYNLDEIRVETVSEVMETNMKERTDSIPGDYNPWNEVTNRKGLCQKYFDYTKVEYGASDCTLSFTSKEKATIYISETVLYFRYTEEKRLYREIDKLLLDWLRMSSDGFNKSYEIYLDTLLF